MTADRNRLTILLSFVVAFVATFAGLLVAHAGPAGPPSIASESGLAAWWQSGALAAPITVLAYVMLIGLERLSVTRVPGLGFLRRGSWRAYLSLAIGAVSVLLPNTIDGSATWGGLSVALVGGMVALRPGGGEAAPT